MILEFLFFFCGLNLIFLRLEKRDKIVEKYELVFMKVV